MSAVEIGDPAERSRICSVVLRNLPDWFGIEAATAAYIRDVTELPSFALDDDAFIALETHNPRAAASGTVRASAPPCSRQARRTCGIAASSISRSRRSDRPTRTPATNGRAASTKREVSFRSRSSTTSGTRTRACSA